MANYFGRVVQELGRTYNENLGYAIATIGPLAQLQESPPYENDATYFLGHDPSEVTRGDMLRRMPIGVLYNLTATVATLWSVPRILKVAKIRE